jgi:hypothetical protein
MSFAAHSPSPPQLRGIGVLSVFNWTVKPFQSRCAQRSCCCSASKEQILEQLLIIAMLAVPILIRSISTRGSPVCSIALLVRLIAWRRRQLRSVPAASSSSPSPTLMRQASYALAVRYLLLTLRHLIVGRYVI